MATVNVFNRNFAIAAAHGITPRVAATWYPKLPRTPRVMVPIHLEALPVRSEGGLWAECTFKTPPKDAPNVSRLDLLPKPFTDLSPRPRGVYLHWALPDGLTRGTASKDQSTASFLAVPDRWLVLRLSPSPTRAARRAVDGWVLRAGDEHPAHVELDKWIETGTTEGDVREPLTALGHGDPAWAAYYDNVVDRFAFYDDLKDVANGPIAYLVCGWYSDPALDPLGSEIHSLADFYGRMNELGWELAQGEMHEAVQKASKHLQAASLVGLPTLEAASVETLKAGATQSVNSTARSINRAGPLISGAGSTPAPLDDSGHPVDGFYTTNGAWWPKQTIYHGAVVGIGWPGIGFPGSEKGLLSEEVGGPPRASDIKVAFGNTLTETLGTLVARANNAPQQARMLEAFMLGALNELDQADGPARVDARLHASSFGSLPGGETTEQIFQPPTPATPPLPVDPGAPDPGIFKRKTRFTTNVEVIRQEPLSTVTTRTESFKVAERVSESDVKLGRLEAAFTRTVPQVAPLPEPGRFITVKRTLPRRFHPSDPVFLLQGAKRSYKHGHDGRFTAEGRPICRLTGFAITELSCSSIAGAPIRPAVRGDDVLERGVENGSVPPECEDLLRETVLLDPGTAAVAAQASPEVSNKQVTAQAKNFMVEQTVWWATRDPRVDQAPLVARSGLAGMLPSPIAVTPPVGPWTPLHLDWRIQFIPSPDGVKDWKLDEIDYQPKAGDLPAANDTTSGIILEGRALLTSGAAATIASGVRKALEQAQNAGGAAALPPGTVARFHSTLAEQLLADFSALTFQVNATFAGVNANGGGSVPAIDRSALSDIATTLEHMDVLAGALDNFHTALRGDVIDNGVSTSRVVRPKPFVPMRAGFLRILRLRLVDCFGQAVDLAGSSEAAIADPRQLIKAEPVEVSSREDIAALPPRFTSPARLWFRFMDAEGTDREANAQINPVCGYLLPNHLDGDLDFYDAAGENLGEVRPEPGAGIVWNDAPGRPSTVGQQPSRAVPNQFLAGLAQGLVDWGITDASLGEGSREDALSALLRIIDSTLWSVDPFGHVGDEHLSLLIGHPVVVIRALVRLEVEEPFDASTINVMKVPLRLGALTHWQDGLLGYFVNDDYRTLYCADAAVAGFAREVGPRRGFLQPVNLVASFYQNFSNDLGVNVTQGSSPVNHPYVNDTGILEIVPNQEVKLTLLVEPHSLVHATTGLTPRKEIGMRREWAASALQKIAPAFRFGPVLVDPKRIRMPVANELNGSWSWDHRTDISIWAEDKVINATDDALLQPDPAKGQEGWLKLTFKEDQ